MSVNEFNSEEDWKAFVDECVSKDEWDKIAEQPRRPLPAKEVEYSLIKEAADGSEAALSRLIYLHFWSIVKYAKRWEGKAKEKEIKFSDLIAVSKYGFARAVFGYATKGIILQFISYTIKWVREMIIRKISGHTDIYETNCIDETNWYQKALEDHKNEENKKNKLTFENIQKELKRFCKEHKIALDEEFFKNKILEIVGPFYGKESYDYSEHLMEFCVDNLDELHKMKQEKEIWT